MRPATSSIFEETFFRNCGPSPGFRGAFERLPLLAYALEDAGCTDADLLGRLRGPGRMCGGAGPWIWCWGRVEVGHALAQGDGGYWWCWSRSPRAGSSGGEQREDLGPEPDTGIQGCAKEDNIDGRKRATASAIVLEMHSHPNKRQYL
jgi:hypothetical protein